MILKEDKTPQIMYSLFSAPRKKRHWWSRKPKIYTHTFSAPSRNKEFFERISYIFMEDTKHHYVEYLWWPRTFPYVEGLPPKK